MNGKITLDTNILVYSVDVSAGEKHKRALEIVREAILKDCSLTLQVLSEFFAVVVRKKISSQREARDQVLDWQELFSVVSATPITLSHAMKAVVSNGLSFWDALLWATAREAGVECILTEDFQNGQELEGVRFFNPFVEK